MRVWMPSRGSLRRGSLRSRLRALALTTAERAASDADEMAASSTRSRRLTASSATNSAASTTLALSTRSFSFPQPHSGPAFPPSATAARLAAVAAAAAPPLLGAAALALLSVATLKALIR